MHQEPEVDGYSQYEIAFIDENKLGFYKSKGDDYTRPHNIFGYLNYHEWLWFHYKHFSHHLAQFGLITYIERFELE